MSTTPKTGVLLGVCALTVALWFVPYAGLALFPLRLLGTFLHETGHALAALATGGAVYGVAIAPDGSGVTTSAGGIRALILPAGYLGATLYGALLIGLLRRGMNARTLLLGTGALLGVITLAFVLRTGNLFSIGWGIALSAALVLAGRRLSEPAAAWTAAFVGVQCALNALFDLKTLLFLSVGLAIPAGGGVSDAAQMQQIFLIPASVWAVVWIAFALGMLWLALRVREAPSPK